MQHVEPCWSVSGTRNGVTDRALLQRLCDPLVYGKRRVCCCRNRSTCGGERICACDSAVEVVGAVFRIHREERNDSVPTLACLNRKQEVCVEVCVAEKSQYTKESTESRPSTSESYLVMDEHQCPQRTLREQRPPHCPMTFDLW